MDSGEITGNKRALSQYGVGITIDGKTYIFYFTGICRETIKVKNYYDSTVDIDIINLIDEAVAFLNDVYNDEFYLYFEMDGIPQHYSQAGVDICPRGCDKECKGSIIASKDCGDVCSEHHKNVDRIAKEAYENLWERNHVVVLWSDLEYTGVYCYGESHESVGTIAAAVSPFGQAGLTTYLPIIQILVVNDGDRTNDMAVNLAHEVAHTLGLQEVRNGFYENAGDHTSDGKTCIMGVLNETERGIIVNGDVDVDVEPLCEFCVQQLKEEIADDVYEAVLYYETILYLSQEEGDAT